MLNQSGTDPEFFPSKFRQIFSLNTELPISLELKIASITDTLANINKLLRDDCPILNRNVEKLSLKHDASTEIFKGTECVRCDRLYRKIELA